MRTSSRPTSYYDLFINNIYFIGKSKEITKLRTFIRDVTKYRMTINNKADGVWASHQVYLYNFLRQAGLEADDSIKGTLIVDETELNQANVGADDEELVNFHITTCSEKRPLIRMWQMLIEKMNLESVSFEAYSCQKSSQEYYAYNHFRADGPDRYVIDMFFGDEDITACRTGQMPDAFEQFRHKLNTNPHSEMSAEHIVYYGQKIFDTEETDATKILKMFQTENFFKSAETFFAFGKINIITSLDEY